MKASNSNLAILILAAGESKRMGTAKAFLQLSGKSLLERTIASAKTVNVDSIYLVTGAYHEKMRGIANKHNIPLIFNPDWQEGMASSLRHGIKVLEKSSHIQGAMVLLIDQPFVDASLLEELIQRFNKNPNHPIASFYKNVNGVPAIFPSVMWKELLELKGDKGARQLLNQREDVISVPFEKGAIDLDFPSDIEQIKRADF